MTADKPEMRANFTVGVKSNTVKDLGLGKGVLKKAVSSFPVPIRFPLTYKNHSLIARQKPNLNSVAPSLQ